MIANKTNESAPETQRNSVFALLSKNIVPLLTLAIVAGACFAVVQYYKKPGQMSVMESQAMDMSAMVPPKGSMPVAIARVSRENIDGSVTYTGTALAYEDEDIFPRIEARIVQMPVYPGQKVSKGQLLVQLDAPQNSEYLARMDEAQFEAQASEHDAGIAKEEFKKNEYQLKAAEAAESGAQSAVAEAQASVDYWQPELRREAELLKKQVISQQEYDNEDSQLKGAQAKLALAKSQLTEAGSRKMAAQADVEMTMHHVAHRYAMSKQANAKAQSAQIIESYRQIVASSEGVITKRLVSPGVVVSPGMLIMKLAHIRKIRLQAELANSDIDKIQVGAPVYYQSSKSSEVREAKVTSIFPAADPSTRTFIVEAMITNLQPQQTLAKPGDLSNLDHYQFLPGQYVIMRIVTGSANGLVIPNKAIVWKEGGAKVWKAVGGQNDKGAASKYTCLMHPEIHEDKPGKCPKCGMELVAQEKSGPLSAELVDVKLGLSNAEKTQVLSGLNENDQVIYEGQEDLQPGMPVVATDWGKSAPEKLPDAADLNSNRLAAGNSFSSTQTVADLVLQLKMTPTPLKADNNELQISVEQNGKAFSGINISGTSSMPDMMAMAGPALQAREIAPGQYVIKCNFSSGLWKADLHLTQSGPEEQHLAVEIEVP